MPAYLWGGAADQQPLRHRGGVISVSPWLPAWLRPHAQEVSFGVTGGRGGAVLGPPVRGVLRTFSALGTEAITGSRERAPGSAHPNTLSPSPRPPPLLSGPCPHPLGLGLFFHEKCWVEEKRRPRTQGQTGQGTPGEAAQAGSAPPQGGRARALRASSLPASCRRGLGSWSR